ncbi:MAG: LptE family protein [Longimonas sp.]|uniref:LPS assembly lipoprotein LptE n=1 Tax=Longimonas sp. TaxID=2039626 RepID=UPI0039766089
MPSRPKSVWLRLLVLLLCLSMSGCGAYSFSGATIPSEIETISIPLVDDRSTNPFPALGNDLTDLLVDRFVDQTRLSLTTDDANADARLNVVVQRYSNEPTTVGADERATANRVTIEVQVEYLDQVNDEEFMSRSFTGSSDYSPDDDDVQGSEEAAQRALTDLADDIFSQATSDW